MMRNQQQQQQQSSYNGNMASGSITVSPLPENGNIINNNDDNDNNREMKTLWSLPPIFAMPPSRSWLVVKILMDFTVILILLIPMLILYAWIEPFHRGFFCDDDSIRYPFKSNTIPTIVLFLYSIGIPVFVICLNEYLIYRKYTRNYELSSRFFLAHYFWQIYLQLIPFLFAIFSSSLITDISKYSLGRLRPHFIDLCRPRLENGTIIDRFYQCKQSDVYLENYSCSQTHEKLKDSRLSFMSGHSSFAAVAFVYLAIYIQFRFRWQRWGLWKPLIQYLSICIVFYTGFSRISDYKHHWSDVLIGIIQGTITALCCSFFISDLYRTKNRCLKTKLPSSEKIHNGNNSSSSIIIPTAALGRESGV